MRIGIFAGYYFPHVGGYEKNVHELAKRLVNKGYEIDIITCNTEKTDQQEIRDGVNIIRIPVLAHIGDVFPIPAIKTLRNDYDVVVTQSRIFITSLLGAGYSLLHNVPLIHVERGSRHTILHSDLLSKMTEVYDHVLGYSITKRASKCIGISQAANNFIRHMNDTADVLTIYNGVAPATIKRKRQNDEIKIVFTGRLVFAKGVQDLISAFDYLCFDLENNIQNKRIPCNVKLVIVGDGNYREQLEKQANQSPNKDKITFTGEVPQEKITEILVDCDIFVNPSYSEGLPTTVMEAASVGLPIIATDVGGTNEIVRNGYSGLLVIPHDILAIRHSLLRIIEYTDWAKQMGENARQISKGFNWDKITDQWDLLLKEVWKRSITE